MQDYYKTIDLFAGIGGIRIGFEQTGRIKNIFSAEIDRWACKTYEANFNENPFCDVTQINEKIFPDFDILLAGFPCQAFSIAGQRGGFEDTRGTLFFDVARLIRAKRPKAFLLENVKGLTNHDKGKTLKTILATLKEDLGYTVYAKILNAKDFGIPQNRERIYIVGFNQKNDFQFPASVQLTKYVKDLLETKEVSSKYYLSETYLNTLRKHRAAHKAKGNGFGFEILNPEGVSNTLVVGGMGKERNLIVDKRLTDFTPKTKISGHINREYIRRTTPTEWSRLQGFPADFIIPVSDAQAYKQFGNSVCVPTIKAVAEQIVVTLDRFNK